MYFVVRFFRMGLDSLGEYSLSGLCVADRKSRRLPVLYGFTRKLTFFSVLFVPSVRILFGFGFAAVGIRDYFYVRPRRWVKTAAMMMRPVSINRAASGTALMLRIFSR